MKFKIFGTEINITFLFAAFVCLTICIDKSGYILYMILAVGLHELAHLFTMKIVGCNPKEVLLIPTSIRIVRGIAVKTCHEIAISLSGPIINILVFLLSYVVFLLTGSQIAINFSAVNLLVGAFNLLPVNGLDGGVALKKLLESFVSAEKARLVLKLLTITVSVIIIFFGIKTFTDSAYNFTPIILGIYLILSVIIKF